VATKYHILTGDALAETFRQSGIEGEIIVAREALIDGPVSPNDPEEFWKQRSEYIQATFNAQPDEYFARVKSEFEKITNIQHGDEINLWFENDLFCQANMWFTISLINKRHLTNVFRVAPLINAPNKWAGFGHHSPADLKTCYEKHEAFTRGDFNLGENLWDAFRNSDVVALAFFSGSLSPCFPYLEEVCKAEIERKRSARPRKVLEDILAQGYTEFSDIFKQFSLKEGIYGYGDLQVGNMLKELKSL
jgi:hypothetical protein